MLNYSLVSTVISDDRSTLRSGMRLLAQIAHKYGIPITWAIDAASARAFASDLTKWHEAHGDEPLLMLDIAPIWGTDTDLGDPNSSAEHIVTMREKLPDYISAEWRKVESAMAWAKPVVAGAMQKNHVLLYSLEQVGFMGLWGYHWGDTSQEYVADRGCPFGCFYPSAEQHNFGGYPASRIVGIPYAAVDPRQIHETQRQRSPEGTDGTDLRMQILDGTAMRRFDDYRANARWNCWLAYIQRIDAAAMASMASQHLEQLDAYFAHVCQGRETQVMPLSEAVTDYQRRFNQTQPTFLLMEPHLEERNLPSDVPAKSTLFYYDAECQFIFEQDKMIPTAVTNYVSPPVNSRYGAEFSLPSMTQFRPSRSRSQLRMAFALESTKAMPYGLAIWGDHTGLTLAASNAHAVTWLGNRLLFVRTDLQAGNNEIDVVLTI